MFQRKKARRAERLRRVATLMMVLCFAIAGARLVTGAAPIVDPRLAAAQVNCTFWECAIDRSPLRLLPETGGGRQMVGDLPALEKLLEQPQTQVPIVAGTLTSAIPTALMFLALALAFRAIGRLRDFAAATRWLRRAALAAMTAAVAEPVAATLRATALSPISTGRQQVFVMFDGPDFLWGIMVAASAWVAVWALEQSLKAERELAKIV